MKRTHLPLNALRVFDAAARHLSFTRAADELAVTPAAVGQQIRALEDVLGVVLFRRTPKGLELTPEAENGLDAIRAGLDWATPELDDVEFAHIDTLLGRFCDDLSTRVGVKRHELRETVKALNTKAQLCLFDLKAA